MYRAVLTTAVLTMALLAMTRAAQGAAQASISPGFNGAFNVTVEHEGEPKPTDVWMTVDDGVRAPATSLEELEQPIAVAIVLCTSPDVLKARTRPPTVLDSLRKALNWSGLKHAGPDGSSYVVIGFDQDVHLIQPRRPLAEFDAQALHIDEDRPLGRAMLAATTVALETLVADPAPRKALIVIGFGDDSMLRINWKLLSDRAHAQHVQIASLDLNEDTIALEPDFAGRRHTTPSDLTSTLRRITTMFPRQSVMTFHPGLLRWDGRPHRFEIWNDNTLLARNDVNLPLASTAPEPEQPIFESWMAAGIAGIGLGAIVAALALIWRRRPAGQLSI
jgi:hypothetical protein